MILYYLIPIVYELLVAEKQAIFLGLDPKNFTIITGVYHKEKGNCETTYTNVTLQWSNEKIKKQFSEEGTKYILLYFLYEGNPLKVMSQEEVDYLLAHGCEQHDNESIIERLKEITE